MRVQDPGSSNTGGRSSQWNYGCENAYHNGEYIARAILPFPIDYVQKSGYINQILVLLHDSEYVNQYLITSTNYFKYNTFQVGIS